MQKDHKPYFADIADNPEDERIRIIARAVFAYGKTVGFIVEDNEKANRYVEKLKKELPGIVIIDRGKGPVDGTVLVRVGPNPTTGGAA